MIRVTPTHVEYQHSDDVSSATWNVHSWAHGGSEGDTLMVVIVHDWGAATPYVECFVDGQSLGTVEIDTGNEVLTVKKGSRTVDVQTGDETYKVKGKRTLAVTGDEERRLFKPLEFFPRHRPLGRKRETIGWKRRRRGKLPGSPRSRSRR